MNYGKPLRYDALPEMLQQLESVRQKNIHCNYQNMMMQMDPNELYQLMYGDFKRDYVQEPKEPTLIETILPKHEKEVIMVLAANESAHFQHLVRKCSDHVRKDISKNYRYIGRADDLRGRAVRLIMLYGWNTSNKLDSVIREIGDELDYMKFHKRVEIIELDNRMLD